MNQAESIMEKMDANLIEGPGCVFTICNLKYLPQALVAISTYSEFHAVDRKSIVVMDLEEGSQIQGINLIPLRTIVAGTNHLVDENLSEIFKHYDITSACTAVKPLALLYFKIQLPYIEFYTYIDPDTFWVGSLDCKFERNTLYFFRHRHDLGRADGYSGYNFLSFGGVNLGLFVDTGTAIENIVAWHKFALNINYESSMLGFYTDQKPADMLVISQRALCIYDERVNLSYWNIADVELVNENGRFSVLQFGALRHLVMFHFSGYKSKIDDYNSDRKEQYLGSKSIKNIIKAHEIYNDEIKSRVNILKSYNLNSNNIGKVGSHVIIRYLYKLKYGKSRSITKQLICHLLSFDFICKLISRMYKIKNPLKI